MAELLDKQPENKNLNRGRWKSGESGNPKGRPRKAVCLTSKVKSMLDKPCPYAPGKTWLEYLAERWLGMSTKNPSYFKELVERLEGKVVQPIEAEIREIKDAEDLSDEQLAVIAAENILKNNASHSSKGTSKKTPGP